MSVFRNAFRWLKERGKSRSIEGNIYENDIEMEIVSSRSRWELLPDLIWLEILNYLPNDDLAGKMNTDFFKLRRMNPV